jgi:hypothetical protein
MKASRRYQRMEDPGHDSTEFPQEMILIADEVASRPSIVYINAKYLPDPIGENEVVLISRTLFLHQSDRAVPSPAASWTQSRHNWTLIAFPRLPEASQLRIFRQLL